MKFRKLKIEGLVLITPDQFDDKRGYLGKLFDLGIFKKRGIKLNITQVKYSYTKIKGTIRGPHIQSKPFEEDKIVQCSKGSIFDVAIDLRPKSKTYCKWFGIVLSEQNKKSLFIPKGFAHGFQTLSNDCGVFYLMSGKFSKKNSVHLKWNDPIFEIRWPLKPTILAERDSNIPLFKKYD